MERGSASQQRSLGYRHKLRTEVRAFIDEVVEEQQYVFTRDRRTRAAELHARQSEVEHLINEEFRATRLRQAAEDQDIRVEQTQHRHDEVRDSLDDYQAQRLAQSERDQEQRVDEQMSRHNEVVADAKDLHAAIDAQESERIECADDDARTRYDERTQRTAYLKDLSEQTHELVDQLMRATTEVCNQTRTTRLSCLDGIYTWVEDFTGRPRD